MNVDQRIAANILKRIAELADAGTLRFVRVSMSAEKDEPYRLQCSYDVVALNDEGVEAIVIFDPKGEIFHSEPPHALAEDESVRRDEGNRELPH